MYKLFHFWLLLIFQHFWASFVFYWYCIISLLTVFFFHRCSLNSTESKRMNVFPQHLQNSIFYMHSFYFIFKISEMNVGRGMNGLVPSHCPQTMRHQGRRLPLTFSVPQKGSSVSVKHLHLQCVDAPNGKTRLFMMELRSGTVSGSSGAEQRSGFLLPSVSKDSDSFALLTRSLSIEMFLSRRH